MAEDEGLSIDSLHLSLDEEESQQEPRKVFLLLFFKLLRAASLYDLKNEALEKPIAEVCTAIRALIEMEGKINVQISDGHFFYNRRKMVLDLDQFDFGEKTLEYLDQRGIRGFVIPDEVNRVQLRSFLQTTVKSNAPLSTIQEKLKRGKIPLILIAKGDATDHSQQEESLYVSEALLRTYLRLLILFHDYVSNLKDLGEKLFLSKRIKRTSQQLIERATAQDQRALGLVTIKNCEEYEANHAVNTAVLVALMGKKLGFKRRALCELVLSSLFHDIGQYYLADSTLRKEGPFTEADWEEMEKHCVLGVRDFMQFKKFNTSLIRRIIVTYEHHKNYDGTGYPTNYHGHTLDIFSQIIAIADNYDALTTPKSYRAPFRPDQALRIMAQEAGRKFDPLLLKAFVQTIGVFPVGSLVRLDSGELGVVVETRPTLSGYCQPRVKLVTDAQGTRIAGEITDLHKDRGKRKIVRTEDPYQISLNIPHLLFGEMIESVS